MNPSESQAFETPRAVSIMLLGAALIGVASFYVSDLPIPEEYRELITPEAFKIQVMIGPLLMAIAAIVAGHFLTRKTRLGTPVFSALLSRGNPLPVAIGQSIAGGIGAITVLMVMASMKPVLETALSQETISALKTFETESLHIVTKFAYGVLAEEIIMRWGLFGALAWASLKALKMLPRRLALGMAVFFASAITTAAHGPALYQIIEDPPQILILYSSGLGFLSSAIACELFIWRGLGASMLFKLFVLLATTLLPWLFI